MKADRLKWQSSVTLPLDSQIGMEEHYVYDWMMLYGFHFQQLD